MIEPVTRSEWLSKMGAKEAQIRALREARTERTAPKTLPVKGSPAGPHAEPGTGTLTGDDVAPVCPRGVDLPVRPRGRPKNSVKANSLAQMKPWEKSGVSRRTWFRRQKK